jgi:Carboxypeptidase regulatory-like domain
MLSSALLFTAIPATAQVENGITGTVTDLSGAVIPSAKITVSNDATGVNANTATSSVGTFTLVGLKPGQYSVTVEAPGFKTYKTDVTVEVAKLTTTSFQNVARGDD